MAAGVIAATQSVYFTPHTSRPDKSSPTPSAWALKQEPVVERNGDKDWGKSSLKVKLHRNISKYINTESLDWMFPFPLHFGGLTRQLFKDGLFLCGSMNLGSLFLNNCVVMTVRL